MSWDKNIFIGVIGGMPYDIICKEYIIRLGLHNMAIEEFFFYFVNG